MPDLREVNRLVRVKLSAIFFAPNVARTKLVAKLRTSARRASANLSAEVQRIVRGEGTLLFSVPEQVA